MEEEVWAIERWTDRVHREGCEVQRIGHAMRCLGMYVRSVLRPAEQQRKEREKFERRRWFAKRKICAYVMSVYKQWKHEEMLSARARRRAGLVCAGTRSAHRVTNIGGVSYDETRRNKKRIDELDKYKVRRWPRRDKCGQMLAQQLYYLWGIT